jgi:cobalt-zinc-cadmium efflux system outer membrane protein
MCRNFLATLLFVSTAAFACEDLDSLIKNALAQNPEIRLLERQIQLLQATKSGAAQPPPRELSLTAGFKSAPDDEGMAWAASISHTFDWSGRPALRRALADQDVALAELGLAAFKAEIAGTLRDLAAQVVLGQIRANQDQSQADRFTALSGVFTQREPSGLPPLLEMRVMEAAALVHRQAVAEARVETRMAEAELNLILGRQVMQAVELEETRFVLAEAPPWEELLRKAEANNFTLQALAAELRRQGLEVDLASLAGKPTWTVQPFLEEERVGGTERTAGIGIARPFANPAASAAEQAAARVKQTQAESLLLAARRDWLMQMGRAYTAYAAHQGQLAVGWDKEIAKLKDAMDTADRHFRLGAVGAATLSELQEQYGEALQALMELEARAVEAGLEVERLSGGSIRLVEWKGPVQ